MTMKRTVTFLVLLCLLLSLSLPVSAAETGTCGDNVTWTLEGSTLTIQGKGAMYDFPNGAPWDAHKDTITTLVFVDVTYIGSDAFRDYDNVSSIRFGYGLYEIGPRAFLDCDRLTEITLPGSFKIFGERSFESCTYLKRINCEGYFPTFRQNCLWDTYCDIYYPAERPWSIGPIRDLTKAFHGRIRFLASDGTDPLATEETTEPTTDPTTDPTTEPSSDPTETTAPASVPGTTTGTSGPEATAGTSPAPQHTDPVQTTPPATFATTPGNSGERGSGTTLLLVLLGIVALLSSGMAVALAIRQENIRRRRARRKRPAAKR